MKTISTRYRKPDFLVLLTFFVGFGVLATSLAQAAEPLNINTNANARVDQPVSDAWSLSLWSLDLAEKMHNWKPKISVDKGGEGIRLMRPFGIRGPDLRVHNNLPDGMGNNLRSRSATYLDAYLFLEKRW